MPLTDRKGESFTLSCCLCPGNKAMLVNMGFPGAIPMPAAFAVAVDEGAGWESGPMVGIRECQHSLRRMLGGSKLC